MRVGSHQGVREGGAVLGEHHPGQVLEVDLVADPGARRHYPQAGQRLLTPVQERVPLGVATVLQVDVAFQGVRAAEEVGDDRVVDDQLGGSQRADPGGIAAEGDHRFPHRGQVHQARHPGEVLQQHAGRGKGDLRRGFRPRIPPG